MSREALKWARESVHAQLVSIRKENRRKKERRIRIMKNNCRAITKEQPPRLRRFLARHRTQRARGQEAMDRITLGECLHLHYALGWTADIRDGHLVSLGGAPAEEAGERNMVRCRPVFCVLPPLPAGKKIPAEKGAPPGRLAMHRAWPARKHTYIITEPAGYGKQKIRNRHKRDCRESYKNQKGRDETHGRNQNQPACHRKRQAH